MNLSSRIGWICQKKGGWTVLCYDENPKSKMASATIFSVIYYKTSVSFEGSLTASMFGYKATLRGFINNA